MKTIPMNLSQFIQTLRGHPDFGSACVYHRYLPSQEALFGEDPGLPGELADLLKQDGITQLFRHQADAIRALRKGGNLLVATATASGKSLIYNLSVLEQLLNGKRGKALYLFPLKALEQDQLKGLRHLTKRVQGHDISAHIYDGDTTAYRRKQIRDKIPDILLTNPDMLHRAILPHHEAWEELFKNLLYIVLDEVHTYRGMFGSHMNQVIRRLKRLCHRHGASPRFVLLSATIENPQEFGESLVGEKVLVIDKSGAPKSGQHFLFLNPAASANFSAARLFFNIRWCKVHDRLSPRIFVAGIYDGALNPFCAFLYSGIWQAYDDGFFESAAGDIDFDFAHSAVDAVQCDAMQPCKHIVPRI